MAGWWERMLERLFFQDQWNIGVVRQSVSELLENRGLASVRWWPSSPATVFRADPAVAGTTIFFERLNRWRGRGELFSADLDGGNARSFLKRRGHLSYPAILEVEGARYFSCEQADSGQFMIYRLVDGFPEPISSIDSPVLDGTMLHHGGLYWVFGTLAGSRSNDALHLWFSESIRGPWQKHPGNPVKKGLGSSRPGGAFFTVGGQLFRPAQDCVNGYGSAVRICRVDRLTAADYAETEVLTIRPPDGAYPCGLHTLQAAGENLVLDGKRRVFHPLAWAFKLRNKIFRIQGS